MLGQRLMPSGIIPTTATVHIVEYGAEPHVQVGDEQGSFDLLQRYTAQQGGTLQPIIIRGPFALCRNHLQLIDTPGLNDVNQHHVDVTTHFIPRADLVIFVLDALQLLKRSEQQFITSHLTHLPPENVLFVVNRIDAIDEEEREEFEAIARERLHEVIGQERPLFFLCAEEALQAQQEADEQLMELSNFSMFFHHLQAVCAEPKQVQYRQQQYARRYDWIMADMQAEIQQQIVIYEQSLAERETALVEVEGWLQQLPRYREELQHYLFERQHDFYQLANRSVQMWRQQVEEDAFALIQRYRGARMRDLAEHEIPQLIRVSLRSWSVQEEQALNRLMNRLQQEISRGLSESFNQQLTVQTSIIQLNMTPVSLEMKGIGRNENPQVKAGLILGGGALAAMAFGASVILPLIAMAGMPFLTERFTEQNREEQRPLLEQATYQLLLDVSHSLTANFQTFIQQNVQAIGDESLQLFESKLRARQQQYTQLRQQKQEKRDEVANEVAERAKWLASFASNPRRKESEK